VLTSNEQLVMLAILRCGRQPYALSIQEEIGTHGHSLTLGVLYTVLNRLESRKLIRFREGEPTARRGDRPKRLYALTALGARELRGCLRILDSLRADVPSPLAN
jgi:DNA-binding PadR family transcriptional regulator